MSSKTSASAIKCKICSKQFSMKSNLIKHLKEVHDKTVRFTCFKCGENFSKKSNLVRHVSSKHSSNSGSNKNLVLIKCIMCDYKCERIYMINHYRSIHNIDICSVEMFFTNKFEFEKWKTEMEKETTSKYIKVNSRQNDNKIIHYFRCHRDGFYKRHGKNVRRLKLLGSNKINGYCPANLTMVENRQNGNIEVNFTKTHVGHDMDLRRITLSKSDKEEIASQISQKIPFDEILNSIRDNISGESLERIHLLSRKDLFNIKETYNLHSDAVRLKVESVNVDSWVTEMREKSNDSVVRIYKRQGELDLNFSDLQEQDFLLVIMNDAQFEILNRYGNDCICINGTHCSNAYNIELTTLLVLDERKEAFPFMFVFSNRTDAPVFNIVFKLIKSLSIDLEPKVFMSDLEEAYKGWCDVMGPLVFRLFCSWNTDKDWRKNIEEKIKNKEQQAYAYKVVRTLTEEKNIAAFNGMIRQSITQMINNPELAEFGVYFQTNYFKNKESWAYSYRIPLGLDSNTDMHLERMDRTIKYVYSKGNTGKKLDKAIYAIMKFVRDKLFERVLKFNKGKNSDKLIIIRNRHKAASTIKECEIVQEDGYWNVRYCSGKDVCKIEKNDLSCSCDLKCSECGVCIHSYTCNCPDYSIKWNMCKHIHLFCLYLKLTNQLSPVTQEENIDYQYFEPKPELIVSELTTDETGNSNDGTEEIDVLKESLKRKFDEILECVTNVEGYKVVKMALSSALSRVGDASGRTVIMPPLVPFNLSTFPHPNNNNLR